MGQGREEERWIHHHTALVEWRQLTWGGIWRQRGHLDHTCNTPCQVINRAAPKKNCKSAFLVRDNLGWWQHSTASKDGQKVNGYNKIIICDIRFGTLSVHIEHLTTLHIYPQLLVLCIWSSHQRKGVLCP